MIDAIMIKEARFNIDDEKSPRPDGFSSTFFKVNWELIKNDFIAGIQEFFHSSRILKELNHVAIALIPKTKHEPSTVDFRPTSCCNVIYNTITKILASKIARVLPHIIDPTQVAFLEERCMSNNMCLAQQLARSYGRKSATPHFMFMVDICKAFDTLPWSFLKSVLAYFGFPNFLMLRLWNVCPPRHTLFL